MYYLNFVKKMYGACGRKYMMKISESLKNPNELYYACENGNYEFNGQCKPVNEMNGAGFEERKKFEAVMKANAKLHAGLVGL